MNKTKEILERKLNAERDEFRNAFAGKTPLEVYEEWYKIHFFESYYELLISNFVDEHEDIVAWLAFYDSPIAFLYQDWLSCSGHFSGSWDDMLDWLREAFESYVASLEECDLLEGDSASEIIKVDIDVFDDYSPNSYVTIYFVDADVIAQYEMVHEDDDGITMKRLEGNDE